MEDKLKIGTLIFLLGAFVTIMVMSANGCNYSGYDFVDTNYHFDYAYISLPNGEVVEGAIKSWSDSEDGEQLTITFVNGDRYLCSSYNCVLVERN